MNSTKILISVYINKLSPNLDRKLGSIA